MRKESTKLTSRRISYYRHCKLLDYYTTCRYQFDSISGTESYCRNSLPSVVLLSADPIRLTLLNKSVLNRMPN